MRVSDIELYHYPATRSARVKWLLHKLVGDEFKVNRIDLYSLEAYGPDYLRLNPNHNVPLIRFRMGDGEPVTAVESGAILTLLADARDDRDTPLYATIPEFCRPSGKKPSGSRSHS
jgi:glutathione S-transferase